MQTEMLNPMDALAELRQRWPSGDVWIYFGSECVKVFRGKTLMTNRATLELAMERVRKYCPIPNTQEG